MKTPYLRDLTAVQVVKRLRKRFPGAVCCATKNTWMHADYDDPTPEAQVYVATIGLTMNHKTLREAYKAFFWEFKEVIAAREMAQ